MTFLEEGNEDYVKNPHFSSTQEMVHEKLINMEKKELLFQRVFKNLKLFQSLPYPFEKHHALHLKCMTMYSISEKELDAL